MREIMFLLVVFLWNCGLILGNTEIYDIDYEDILSEELMPTKLLVLQNLKGNVITNKSKEIDIKANGSLSEAMKTMGFHR